jgi:FixJ family two-component response regulator
VSAVKQGAVDFLEKPVHAGNLREKVQAALASSREMYSRRLSDQTREARLALLTAREREIVELVAIGKTSREIATLFSLSPRTVENHRCRAMEKLHVGSAVELARILG